MLTAYVTTHSQEYLKIFRFPHVCFMPKLVHALHERSGSGWADVQHGMPSLLWSSEMAGIRDHYTPHHPG